MMSVAAGGGSIAAGSAEIGHTMAPHHTTRAAGNLKYTEGATIMMTIMKQLE